MLGIIPHSLFPLHSKKDNWHISIFSCINLQCWLRFLKAYKYITNLSCYIKHKEVYHRHIFSNLEYAAQPASKYEVWYQCSNYWQDSFTLEQFLHYSADSHILYYKPCHSKLNERTHYFHNAGYDEILTAMLLMSQFFWNARSTGKVTNILEDNCLQPVGQAVYVQNAWSWPWSWRGRGEGRG